jgi:glutathione peroxidase
MMISALAAAAIIAPASLFDFSVSTIDGDPKPLADYKGKVVIVVNTASKCGLTPQYEGLEALYKKHKDAGLVVLGFPANNFNGQEPGTNAEIKAFCTGTYDVSFPMFSKISVKGPDQHPLYRWLVRQVEPVADIEWNFAKFLVGKDGKVIQRFPSRTAPNSPEFTEAVSKALAATE